MGPSESCHELLGSLCDYIDGDLSQELCAELERHIAECDHCRIVVDTLRKTIYLYHVTNPASEVPGEVRERLFQTLHLDEFIEKES